MDLYTAFTKIPKEELSSINEPSWIDEHKTRPINLNFNKSFKFPIVLSYQDGSSDTYQFTEKGLLVNMTYVKEKEG